MEDRKKQVIKSLHISQLKDERHFRALLGAYVLQNNLCQPLELESYLNNELNKFPHDVKLLRNFIEYLSDEDVTQFIPQKTERGSSTKVKDTNSSMDVSMMAKQLASSNPGKRR